MVSVFSNATPSRGDWLRPSAAANRHRRRWAAALRQGLLFFCAISVVLAEPSEGKIVRQSQPRMFSYNELLKLGRPDPFPRRLSRKLEAIRTTPFLSNRAFFERVKPHQPEVAGVGTGLRLVAWNIERGLQIDDIRLLLSDPEAYEQRVRQHGNETDWDTLRKELEVVRSADVLVLNEVDWGLKRTGYRAIARDLAQLLRMNWAFGVDFVEVDPICLGIEDFAEIEDQVDRDQLQKEIAVDAKRLRALHGSAVLSRYPIRDARLIPFQHQGYDWFAGEIERVAILEKGKREVAETVFREKISREVRRGGRGALLVTLEVPDLPQGLVTIAATHLESRTEPENRRHQMEELLTMIEEVRHPVILAGDLNTSLSDSTPTNWQREVHRRIGSKAFWANVAVKYSTGVGLLYDVFKGSVNFFKNQQDPTAADVPLIAPNPEAALFELLEEFRFQDGTVFDFRGDKTRTINGTGGTLANSNQRDDKGFAVTFEVDRTIGPAGKLKLDWIFVKAYLENPRNAKGPYRFAPHFARTMEELNYSLEDRLSDHNPISVDLPFKETPLESPDAAAGGELRPERKEK